MSDKMRQYMVAFWVLLTLSVFHFALAAPVAVREIVEVRSNPVEVLKDGIAAWEKRMNSEDKDQLSTNDAHLVDSNDEDQLSTDDAHLTDPNDKDQLSTNDAHLMGPNDKGRLLENHAHLMGSNDKDQLSTNDAHLMDAVVKGRLLANHAHLMDPDDKDELSTTHEHLMDPNDKDQLSTNDVYLNNKDRLSTNDVHLIDPDSKDEMSTNDVYHMDPNDKDEMTNDVHPMDPNDKDLLWTSDAHLMDTDGKDPLWTSDAHLMDTDDKDQLSTNDAHLIYADPGDDSDHPDAAPGGDEKGANAEGVKEEGMWGWKWPWNSEELPDSSYYNNPPEGESDGSGDRAMQSSQGPAENMSPSPQSEHPATPEHTSFLEKLYQDGKGSLKTFRPRNSGSGGDMPKRSRREPLLTPKRLMWPPPEVYTISRLDTAKTERNGSLTG